VKSVQRKQGERDGCCLYFFLSTNASVRERGIERGKRNHIYIYRTSAVGESAWGGGVTHRELMLSAFCYILAEESKIQKILKFIDILALDIQLTILHITY
jgi:hypothetical protein